VRQAIETQGQAEAAVTRTPEEVKGRGNDGYSPLIRSGSFAARDWLGEGTTPERVGRRPIDAAARSEVCFKVQQNVLSLREFTFAQIKRATGLKDSSVRTQLQRMREQGYLTSHRSTDSSRHRMYRLTNDPQKRLELAGRVGAFSSGSTENQELAKPSSQAFQRLRFLVYQVYESLLNTTKAQELVLQATVALRHAWLAEGIDMDEEEESIRWVESLDDEDEELTPRSIRAYLGFERLQLSYLSQRLSPRWEGPSIQTQLDDLRYLSAYFTDRDPLMLEQIQALQIQFRALQLQSEDCLDPDLTPAMHAAQCLLKAITSAGYQQKSSLFQEVQQYLWHLSQPAATFISKEMIQNSVRDLAQEEMGRTASRATDVGRLQEGSPLAQPFAPPAHPRTAPPTSDARIRFYPASGRALEVWETISRVRKSQRLFVGDLYTT